MKTKTTVRDYADGALVRETITERDVPACACGRMSIRLDPQVIATVAATGAKMARLRR